VKNGKVKDDEERERESHPRREKGKIPCCGINYESFLGLGWIREMRGATDCGFEKRQTLVLGRDLAVAGKRDDLCLREEEQERRQ